MIKNIIKKISNEFLTEAINSPSLLTDMASMERYMAESYGDRILIELLQNSDDAQSTKAKVLVEKDFVIFANNGRPFNEKDVISICRSGASSKIKGIHIGHRGIGFKSTTSMSNQIIIYSNDTYFTFSKKHCADVLGVNEKDVPTVRVPFLIDDNEIPFEVRKRLEVLKDDGLSTAFIFLNAKNEIINREILSFNDSCLLFLNCIKELDIAGDRLINISLVRETNEMGENVQIKREENVSSWWIPKDDFRYFAFKMKGNDVCECSIEEAVFHNFMPTLEKTPFLFKINSTFPTDPSRKNITLDSDTKQNLIILADKLFELIDNCCQNKLDFKNILKLFVLRNSYSPIAVYLYNLLFEKLKKNLYIILNNGKKVLASKYELLDESFDYSEKVIIRKFNKELLNYSCINNSILFEEFVSLLSDFRVSENIYKSCLENKDFVSSITSTLYNKLFAYVVKKNRVSSIINKTKVDFNSIYLKNNEGIILLKDSKNEIENIQTLKQSLSSDEFNWFSNLVGIDNDKSSKISSKVVVKNIETGTFISRWRSAEQQVVDIEIMEGNDAKYVGNQNLGYDVFSKTPEGENRYIEVKLLSSDKGEFTLTNNEYTAAHQLGENYFICLLVQKETEIKVTYIKNPLYNLQLEKRVKQWEWYCDEYSGDVKIFKYGR